MRKVSSCELTPGSYDRLLRLLKVGPFDVDPALSASVSGKTPVASTSCERSVGGEPSEASQHGSSVAFTRQEFAGASRAVAVGPSVVLRSMASSAETVLADDDEQPASGRSGVEPLRIRGGVSNRRVCAPQQQTAATAQSPTRHSPPPQSKKVQFDVNGDVASSDAAAAEPNQEVGSPEHKYRQRIEKKMSEIQDMLSSFNSLDDAPLGRHQQTVGDSSK
ncbi:hypothetical protein PybrP1_000953 [[Pythium] brassicae (nom. inval.)]|nr:hypothetical protein PybrP1_000953 [[Pythium] brassicae (nom. inval.)]